MKNMWHLIILIVAVVMVSSGAFADVGQPYNWQMGLQDPVSPVAQQGHDFFNMIMWIMTGVCVFVLFLLLFVLWRFSEKKNPVPAKFSHHTWIEIIWTLVPVLILLVIMVPSFRLLYYSDKVQQADMTVKIIGKQWYWSYEYPDEDDLSFDSILIDEKEVKKQGKIRLLDVDNMLVLPVETNIRLLVTSSDVIHNWAVPSLFVKMDAVPGRLNETWTRIPEKYAGKVLYGQCSELCGVNHAFMPIAVKVVTKQEYDRWILDAREKFGQATDAFPHRKFLLSWLH